MRSVVLAFFIVVMAFSAFGQDELNSKGEPVAKNEQNRPVELKKGEKIKRGEELAKGVMRVSVEKVFDAPDEYADRTVEVEGVIVRSCKTEGCWLEMADKEGGRSVRVTFGDHKFFIPLNSAGMKVRAQGVFKTNVLSKEKVDHLVNDDGAKFENVNPDGTVTEVSFDATGVVLTKLS
jgi:hypothetical protein